MTKVSYVTSETGYRKRVLATSEGLRFEAANYSVLLDDHTIVGDTAATDISYSLYDGTLAQVDTELIFSMRSRTAANKKLFITSFAGQFIDYVETQLTLKKPGESVSLRWDGVSNWVVT